MFTHQIQKIKKAILLLVPLVLVACGGGDLNNGADASEVGTGGNPGGVTVTNVFSSPKELGVGDLMYVDFGLSSELNFEGVGGDAEFNLVVVNTSAVSGNFTVQISGDLAEAGLATSESAELLDDFEDPYYEDGLKDILNDFTPSFHEALRFREEELEALDNPAFSVSPVISAMGSVVPDFAIGVGDKRDFKVLGSLSSNSQTVTVTGIVKCVGTNIAMYVDERVTSDMLSDSEVQTLCSEFDNNVIREYSLFGNASDVNGDGVVIALLTPQVNKLGALGGGIITGFFTASDLYPSTTNNASSNYMEILYIMVPDPSGTYGVQISKNFALKNLLPPVLVHELQHAINYNQHVFLRNSTSEESWLNEGLSHLAEDLLGQGQENPSRYNIFLNSPHSYPLVTAGSPGLGSRGAAYLFLRYLYEQSSGRDQFISRLLKTGEKGVKNVEQAFGETASDFDQFGEFFLRWSIALALTDRGISVDRRFTYQPRAKDSGTGHWGGVCLVCSAGDGRGTMLRGIATKSYSGYQHSTLAETSMRVFGMDQLVAEKIRFNRTGNQGAGFGVLIRTK